MLQNDLDKVKDQWNSHYIRKSHFDTISGIPDILYWLPEYVDEHDRLVPLTGAKIREMVPHCEIEKDVYTEYFTHVMEELEL